MTRRLLPLVLTLLAFAAVLAGPASAANPVPPTATSGSATSITLTGATLTALLPDGRRAIAKTTDPAVLAALGEAPVAGREVVLDGLGGVQL